MQLFEMQKLFKIVLIVALRVEHQSQRTVPIDLKEMNTQPIHMVFTFLNILIILGHIAKMFDAKVFI